MLELVQKRLFLSTFQKNKKEEEGTSFSGAENASFSVRYKAEVGISSGRRAKELAAAGSTLMEQAAPGRPHGCLCPNLRLGTPSGGL